MPSPPWPRILAEELQPLAEPLALLLRPRGDAAPAAVAAAAARALLDVGSAPDSWPPWLAAHQVPAARRLDALVHRHGGAVLADAVGLGKSYVALAVAARWGAPLTLVVPGVLVPQWRALLARLGLDAAVVTHEALSRDHARPAIGPSAAPPPFVVVDEAHRFRNPDTHRYRALARLVVGTPVLLVTATPVHNRLGDLFHLFRLFLRDHALAALGVPSLRRAAHGDLAPERAAAVAARLVVSRSRERVRGGYGGGPLLRFPERAPGRVVRAGPAPEPLVAQLVQGIGRLEADASWTPLLRLLLLRRLASSLPALRATLERCAALLDVAHQAADDGRALSRREFRRLFPPGEGPDLQLALFPLLLEPGAARVTGDPDALLRLRALAAAPEDPKADALAALLGEGVAKTIVFTDARPTVRHLLRRLRGRLAAVSGRLGVLGSGVASRTEALRAFAPLAQGGTAPRPALEADVLVATDLVSEGLNLQDAARVIHYDLPWTPARLAQRVGRIDRLGSPHHTVETVSFVPPAPLADAIALEERLAAKARAQAAAGAAQIEGLGGRGGAAGFDWCDRLQRLARGHTPAAPGACATVAGPENAVVLVVRVADLVDALVVSAGAVSSDPPRATEWLESAAREPPLAADRAALDLALRRAAPLVRARLAAVQEARWRAGDRDRLSRRLIPWALAAARRAARRGDPVALARLDGLVGRLTLGMTAGEELLLGDLLERRAPLAIPDLLAWHERLPDVDAPDTVPEPELVGALVVRA